MDESDGITELALLCAHTLSYGAQKSISTRVPVLFPSGVLLHDISSERGGRFEAVVLGAQEPQVGGSVCTPSGIGRDMIDL